MSFILAAIWLTVQLILIVLAILVSLFLMYCISELIGYHMSREKMVVQQIQNATRGTEILCNSNLRKWIYSKGDKVRILRAAFKWARNNNDFLYAKMACESLLPQDDDEERLQQGHFWYLFAELIKHFPKETVLKHWPRYDGYCLDTVFFLEQYETRGGDYPRGRR